MDTTTSALLREIGIRLEPLNNLNDPFYLDPNFLGAILTSVIALGLGLWSIWIQRKHSQHIEKQLQIEQEPYVVTLKGISIDGYGSYGPRDNEYYLKMHLKNIGRGPAIRITTTGSESDPNAALMDDKEPHSIDLGSKDEYSEWKIDETILNKLIHHEYKTTIDKLTDKQHIYLYIFYTDQLKKQYKTIVKLQRSNAFLKVMENQRSIEE